MSRARRDRDDWDAGAPPAPHAVRACLGLVRGPHGRALELKVCAHAPSGTLQICGFRPGEITAALRAIVAELE